MNAQDLLLEAEQRLRQRRLEAALQSFDSAELQGADPDRCAGGRWMAHMLRGELEAAWQQSDAIRRRGAPDPHRLWQGEELRDKRVIVRCLHGLGDAIQFLRYLPLLRRVAGSVIVETSPRFTGLARCLQGAEDVLSWEDAASRPPVWDVQIEVMELPYLFRTRRDDLPVLTKYLEPPQPLQREAARALGASGDLRVGLVWAAGEWNPQRSLPLELLRPLLQVRGCEFWNLQGGEAAEQWSTLQPSAALREDPRCTQDLLLLAAFVSQMDLVTTVDSLAAHLGGALGVPTWVMLPQVADWRWMHLRADCPWYPSLRLFRQSSDDWRPVVASVRRCLEALAPSRREADDAAA